MAEFTTSRRIVWFGAALMLATPTVGRSQSPPTLAQTAHQFQFGTMPERMQAFYVYDRVPGAWTQPGAAQALLALFEREDSLAVAVIRESGGTIGAGDKYGEGYAEYDGDVEYRCEKYCDQEALLAHLLANVMDTPELRMDWVAGLANSYTDPRYSPADRARIDAAFIFAAHDSTSFLTRAAALAAIGVAIRSGLPSPAERARFHQAVLADTSDTYVGVRRGVIARLIELQDPADSALIRRLTLAKPPK